MEPGNHEPAESTDAFKSSFVMDTGKFRSWDWRSKLGGPYPPVTHWTAAGATAAGMLHPPPKAIREAQKSSMKPSFIVRGSEAFDGTNHYIMMDYYQTVDGKLLHPLGHRPSISTIVGPMDSVGFVLGSVTVW